MPVHDLHKTIDYYRDVLGFSREWFWEEHDAGIRRDNMHLLFNHAPEFVSVVNSNGRHFEIMWFVDNVREIYDEYKAKNVKITGELEEKPWGVMEFTIEDINGYFLRIAEGLEQAGQ